MHTLPRVAYRAMSLAVCIACAWLSAGAQPAKEYIYLGDRLIGVENFATGLVLSPTAMEFQAAGGSGSIGVQAPVGQAWTASSTQPWLTIASGASGNGPGTIAISVTANPSAARSAAIQVGSATTAINQLAGGTPTGDVRPISANPSNGSGGSTRFTFRMGGGANARTMVVLFNFALQGNQSCFISIDRVSTWIGLAHSVGGNWTGAEREPPAG